MPNKPIAIVALLLSACTSNGVVSQRAGLPPLSLRFVPQSKIQHIVIVVQENRSFNDLFDGYPGATTAKYGYDTKGHKIALQPVGLEANWDINHRAANFFAACDGTGSIPGTNCKMDGFDNETWTCSPSGYPKCPNANPPYSYVPHGETKPYFAMANQYVLADRMYASNFDSSSFISHQYIIAAQAESAVDYPASAWGCPGGSHDKIPIVGPQRQIPYGSEVVCWDPTTLGDEFDNAGISWGYYAVGYTNDPGLWSAYQAIKHIYYGADWNKDVVTPPSQFLTDVANGNLRSVSWVTPTWADSDHSGVGSKTGPSWVASVVNAVGESKYWNSSAIFVMWDDYGGWFDSEPPPYVDYDGLGIRLPLLIISPYAKKGHVSHVHYEHGSILRFVEDTFGLGRLSASDARAKSPARDCFDFKQPPRTFVPIKAPFGAEYFKREQPDNRIPDTE